MTTKTFYVSFGGGSPLRNVVIKIEGKDVAEVRAAMDRSMKGFCNVYIEKDFKEYQKRHSPTIIESGLPAYEVDLL